MRRLLAFNVMVWTFVVYSNVWATQHGSPQHVWLFCGMLGWCHR